MKALTFQLLGELSHERFVSGATLAARHGLSRSAISAALKEAHEQGIEIFSLTRKGYRLAAPLELLDVDRIRDALGARAHRIDAQVVTIIDSTNSELLKRSGAGAAGGTCLAAEIQTAGRGRRGRQWQSALGASLTFSLLWRFDKGVAQLSGLSLAVGLAIARALRKTGLVNAKVKWPNDIVIDDKKLAGILIETQGDMLGPTAAVIGIGLNIRLPAALKEAIDQPVTDMAEQIENPSRNGLLAAMLSELVPMLDQFNAEGFTAFREEWLACHALQGMMVWIKEAGREDFAAVVKDVANDGALIVSADGKNMPLNAGEISVRADAEAGRSPRSKAAS